MESQGPGSGPGPDHGWASNILCQHWDLENPRVRGLTGESEIQVR